VIDVTLGNAARFVYNADGADGFRYDIQCYGNLLNGGTVDQRLTNAYGGAYYLRLDGEFFPCATSARLEENTRELVIGPAVVRDLEVTRKVFVPTAGRFIRFLETLHNPTAMPITVSVDAYSILGASADTPVRVLVAPTATNTTFAVTDQLGACCSPVLAHVFGGPGAPVAVESTHLANGQVTAETRWVVTVPPNQTVILMHFGVQRDVMGQAGAQAQAQALVALTDTLALEGMETTERAAVRNFVIP
jgi:hypothetical protein